MQARSAQPTQSLNDDDIYVIDLTTRKIVEQHGSGTVAAHAMRSGAVWGVRPGQALLRGLQARALLSKVSA
jgi:hypothetical protein